MEKKYTREMIQTGRKNLIIIITIVKKRTKEIRKIAIQ